MCKFLFLFFPLLFISLPFFGSRESCIHNEAGRYEIHTPQNVIISFNNNVIHKGLLHLPIGVTHLALPVKEKQFEQKDSLV